MERRGEERRGEERRGERGAWGVGRGEEGEGDGEGKGAGGIVCVSECPQTIGVNSTDWTNTDHVSERKGEHRIRTTITLPTKPSTHCIAMVHTPLFMSKSMRISAARAAMDNPFHGFQSMNDKNEHGAGLNGHEREQMFLFKLSFACVQRLDGLTLFVFCCCPTFDSHLLTPLVHKNMSKHVVFRLFLFFLETWRVEKIVVSSRSWRSQA